MKIYPATLEYEQLPSVMGLLNSVAFYWFVVLVTTGVFVWLIAKLWSLHSIPKVLAKEKGYAQGRLVFWLCMLGLIWKPLWILAVMAVVVDWDALTDWLRSLKLPPGNTPGNKGPADASDNSTVEPVAKTVESASKGGNA